MNGDYMKSQSPNDVLTKFTGNYGGNKVSLTGSFNKWNILIPMEKNGPEFSVTLVKYLNKAVITQRSASVISSLTEDINLL